jgi:hypothetical protein
MEDRDTDSHQQLTGLLVALAGLYLTYILPRWVPALRGIIGLPGI